MIPQIRSVSRSFHSTSRNEKRDYYEVLGVPKGASKSDIKKKYFELAKKFHPDVNRDDTSAGEKFREASEAYEVLENDEKRKMYDNFGHAGVDQASAAGAAGGNPFAQGFGGFGGFGGPFGGGNVQWEFRQGSPFGGGQQVNNEQINELFEELFGGGRGRQRRGHGSDVRTTLRLSFLEAISGCSKDVQVDVPVRTGSDGKKARQMKRKTVTLQVPRGVEDGVTLRVVGEGGEGEDGQPAGSLYVDLKVASDSYFRRDGVNIGVEVPITVTQAILGGTVDVLTLNGMVELKVPAGTQPGTQIVMRGKGVAMEEGGREIRGNQYVTFKLQYPKNLTDRQKELLEELEEEERKKGKTVTFSMNSAWKRVKDFFGHTDSGNSDSEDTNKSNEAKV
eukprot:CAMPEP_0182422458 /NCGR_PEP_ID=MMETSP1167-20130531/8163_1 /TAXON_ID=2988 /ORGANISM="Mallomonas Sp, Strain CCMP3275" /LENGTH=391 /DNA_ID=CAMNT_0024600541 /DNA_START=292 /DNA_END=1467 /DNA_ORIENTATION=-